MKKGKLIILSAPSGAGKTSACKLLMKRNPNWSFSVSATTRDLRESEVEGVDYVKFSNIKFEKYIKEKKFIEWEEVHGNKYGTIRDVIIEKLDSNEIVLLDLDVKGGLNIFNKFSNDSMTIFIEPPGNDINEKISILWDRLKLRNCESDKIITKRLERFKEEMKYKKLYQHIFINKDLMKMVEKIEDLIKEKTK